jgi:hypothetical protein
LIFARTAAALLPRRARISAARRCLTRLTAVLLGLVISFPACLRTVTPRKSNQRHDARLGLVERQAPRGQPRGHARLDLLGLFLGVAQGDHVIGVDHQGRASAFRASWIARLVADSGRLLQPVERDIQEAW